MIAHTSHACAANRSTFIKRSSIDPNSNANDIKNMLSDSYDDNFYGLMHLAHTVTCETRK